LNIERKNAHMEETARREGGARGKLFSIAPSIKFGKVRKGKKERNAELMQSRGRTCIPMGKNRRSQSGDVAWVREGEDKLPLFRRRRRKKLSCLQGSAEES